LRERRRVGDNNHMHVLVVLSTRHPREIRSTRPDRCPGPAASRVWHRAVSSAVIALPASDRQDSRQTADDEEMEEWRLDIGHDLEACVMSSVIVIRRNDTANSSFPSDDGRGPLRHTLIS